jgi:hypothetical protein
MSRKRDAMILTPTDEVLPGRVLLGELFDIFDGAPCPTSMPPARSSSPAASGGERANRWRFWGLNRVDL